VTRPRFSWTRPTRSRDDEAFRPGELSSSTPYPPCVRTSLFQIWHLADDCPPGTPSSHPSHTLTPSRPRPAQPHVLLYLALVVVQPCGINSRLAPFAAPQRRPDSRLDPRGERIGALLVVSHLPKQPILHSGPSSRSPITLEPWPFPLFLPETLSSRCLSFSVGSPSVVTLVRPPVSPCLLRPSDRGHTHRPVH
jgi:hypothetical protein